MANNPDVCYGQWGCIEDEQQWLRDHPDGIISAEEQRAMDDYVSGLEPEQAQEQERPRDAQAIIDSFGDALTALQSASLQMQDVLDDLGGMYHPASKGYANLISAEAHVVKWFDENFQYPLTLGGAVARRLRVLAGDVGRDFDNPNAPLRNAGAHMGEILMWTLVLCKLTQVYPAQALHDEMLKNKSLRNKWSLIGGSLTKEDMGA